MSAIGGFYSFDGAPVRREVFDALDKGLSSRGPDGGNTATVGQVSMVYRGFYTTIESRRSQPALLASGGLITLDGRLDNRSELISVLEDRPGALTSDVEIIAAAYERWGPGFVSHLIGDYALSLWDAKQQQLFLARDPFGTRPLFYSLSGKGMCWSSELQPLLDLYDCSEIDEDYIAGFLTATEDPGRTPYKRIASVEPGTVLRVGAGAVRKDRYWRIDPGREIRYSTDREYEEHFLAVFTQAVASRLRADGPVVAELSGGLDSSSIVCVADRILNAGGAQASAVKTVSYVYEESTTSDERTFIESVEALRNIQGHHISESLCPFFSPFAGESSVVLPSPMHAFAATIEQLIDFMNGCGARVLLTGHGGDHILLNEQSYFPILGDLVQERRLTAAARYLHAWSKLGRVNYAKLIWQGVLWPLLPLGVRVRVAPQSLQLSEWLEREFIQRLRCRERALTHPESRSFRGPARQRQYTLLRSAISWVSAGFYRERGCIDATYPFLDRSLVEFLFAIPIDQLHRPGQTRSVQRRALSALLPEKIANRRFKRGPDESVHRGISKHWHRLEALAREPRVSNYRFVNPDAFRQALIKAKHGVGGLHFLLRTVSLEHWLRAQEVRYQHQPEAGMYEAAHSPSLAHGRH